MPAAILLCCPACGDERQLRDAEGLPHGASRLIALCPECVGHGADACLLIFDDGRIERVRNDVDRPGAQRARNIRIELFEAQLALPLPGAARDRPRRHTRESIARG